MIKNPFFNFEPTGLPLQAGNILISVPLSGDFYFDRTVVLLVEHNENGSFGFVLNKSLPLMLKDLFPKETQELGHISLYNGGPVDAENLFALHTYGNLIKGSTPIANGLYLGGLASQLLTFIKSDFLDEHFIRFYLGYSGWSQGQLEAELSQDLWLVGTFQEKLLFHDGDENCWNMAVDSLGENYSSWFNIAQAPYLN
ncbi:MAG: YqgE/AlgH family protein [Bacteroidales bacterium]|jgi:putative transcriptional regulator|nr:YqgE/AlgH family protein [Bacteroidales bacterium]